MAHPRWPVPNGRARQLCLEAGDAPQLFSVLVGLWRFYFTQGALVTTRELAEQLLAMAEDARDPALLLEARTALAMVSLYLGDPVGSRDNAAQGLALYDPRQHRSHAFVYGQDPGANCLSYAAWSLLVLGYADQSREKTEEMLALAAVLSHPLSLARALCMSAIFHYFRREPQAVRERIDEAMALATEKGFSYWVHHGAVLQGWLMSIDGRHDEALARIRQGLAGFLAMGAELTRPWQLALLATITGAWGGPTRDSACWTKRSRWSRRTASGCTRLRSIGCGESCYSGAPGTPTRRPRSALIARSPPPASSRRDGGSSGPR
jgi:predicted ATPase